MKSLAYSFFELIAVGAFVAFVLVVAGMFS